MYKSFTVAVLFWALQVVSSDSFAMSCEEIINGVSKERTAAPTTPSSFVRKFFAATDPIDVIRMSLVQYPEFAWLTGKVNATPEGRATAEKGQSLSEQIFGEKHIEFDRTATGILLIKWILEGNYDAFCRPQNGATKMTRENFNELRSYTRSILKTPEDIDAMITYMVINDLGKIKSIVSEIEKRAGIHDVDHDNLLLIALERHPDLSPSFARLGSPVQQKMIRGLKPKFNIGQFIQAENLPASLSGLKGLDKESLDFYLLHAIADIGGAAGHVNWQGSVVMTNPTYEGFKAGVKAIEGLARGNSEVEVYNEFLEAKGRAFNLDIGKKEERAIARLVAMLRISDMAGFIRLKTVFASLPTNAKAILTKELNVNGTNDGFGTLLYYSPALLANAVGGAKNSNISSEVALEAGLLTLARLYQDARLLIKSRQGNGVFTVLISKIAEMAKNPNDLLFKPIEIDMVGQDGEAKIAERPMIDASKFSHLNSLANIPGKTVAVIGIGGGSDGIQAAQLGLLLRSVGKNVKFIGSVRTDKTGSQGSNNQVGENRTISDHGGEVTSGVFRVLPTSTGSGRFLENIPADQIPTYLILDRQNNTLASQFQNLLTSLGGVDTLIALDTGGDALFPTVSGEHNQGRATPDQDLRVITTLKDIPVSNKLSIIVAAGVDSPLNAQQILQAAAAQYYALSDAEAGRVMRNYQVWGMDGTNENRFGKTPLAWQLAITNQLGLQVMPLPTRVVVDGKNPWNPFVIIQNSMKGFFIMGLQNHLSAIGIPR
jgi:hypothetical protein